MDEGATWYGSRPRPRPNCIRWGPTSAQKGHRAPIFSAHVYCGQGHPPQLLLCSCTNGRPKMTRSESFIIPFLVAHRKIWLTPTALVPCSNADNTGERKAWMQIEFCISQKSIRTRAPKNVYIVYWPKTWPNIVQSFVNLRSTTSVQ